ncbi:hypothetical protein EVAR_89960_1 [Eumeta japonica]|uniref:Uncharacterized protein n=1 Tax=Eumeta variegata TaxID=151549 RepID=A0A4C2ACA1_EUMVA|nr:hypothetical protein EVAR_89960_1 [Eumeta japonica]
MEERAPACYSQREWQAGVGSQSLSSDHPTSGFRKIPEKILLELAPTARRHQWKPARLVPGRSTSTALNDIRGVEGSAAKYTSGPCFKTGPASARNRITIRSRLHGGRIDAGAQRRGPHSGGTSNATTPRVGPDARRARAFRIHTVRWKAGRPPSRSDDRVKSPAPNGAQTDLERVAMPLLREVHAVPGDDTHDPRPPTRPRKTEIDGRPGRPYARSTETNVESLRCTLKQPDSEESPSPPRSVSTGLALRESGPVQDELDGDPTTRKRNLPNIMSRDRYDRAIRRWALSCSLAATRKSCRRYGARQTRYPSARRRAASTSSPPTADISLRKISRCAAHIAPVVSSIRRFDYDTELPYVESDLCRDANTKTTRATFVRGGVIEIRTNNIFKRTTRKTISTHISSLGGDEKGEKRVDAVNCRTAHAHGERERVRNVAFVIYGRPSDRSGPGCVSTDRNVRSKCRSTPTAESHRVSVRRPHQIIQSGRAVYKGQGRNQRELMTALTRNSSFMGIIANPNPSTKEFQRVAGTLAQGEHADSFSVARVRPGHLRASQTCYCSISCGSKPPVPLRRF